jgi:signal transduction histidine kinase
MLRGLTLPPIARSLSARLLVLTVAFVMLSEIMIFVPSIARFRMTYFADRLAAGRLAVFALEATPDNMVSQQLADRLLSHVGAVSIVLHQRSNVTLMIDSEMPPTVDATFDLREMQPLSAIGESIATLVRTKDRVLRVLDQVPDDPMSVIEVVIYEEPLHKAMSSFATRILDLSIIISLVTAGLVYLTLQWLLVRPMRSITAAITDFSADPEDAGRVITPSERRDEIGVAQRALAAMQETVRQSLRQRARLAALGTAVTKINHDLRGILSTARLVSDSLAESAAPEVRRVAPTLLAAIDRAVNLCTRTLDFTRDSPPPMLRQRFAFTELVGDVAEALAVERDADPRHAGALAKDEPRLRNEVPADLVIDGDRDQLYRVLFNLCHNAVEAGAHHVTVGGGPADGLVVISVTDDGPGLPPKARDNLFQPFTGSARLGGTGLGLAIARELMRAHGGDIALVESTATGTVFRLTLPAPPPEPPAARSLRSSRRAPRSRVPQKAER